MAEALQHALHNDNYSAVNQMADGTAKSHYGIRPLDMLLVLMVLSVVLEDAESLESFTIIEDLLRVV